MLHAAQFFIGNQTAFSAPPAEPFAFALQHGFSAFEWLPDKKVGGSGWSIDDIPEPERDRLRAQAYEQGLRISVHSPCDLSLFDQGAPETIRRHIEFAHDTGAVLLNLHLEAHRGIAAFIEALRPLLDGLAQRKFLLAIENTPLTGPDDFNRLFRELRRSGTPDTAYVGMCVDIGHANLCAATRNNYVRFIDLLDDDIPIIHAHFHENFGDRDAHLPLFTGASARDSAGVRDALERLFQRDFFGSIILEQWPDPPQLLLDARGRLQQLIDALQTAQAGPEPDLPPVDDDVALLIARADRKNRSWREKLGWIEARLCDAGGSVSPGLLSGLAVYLRFIGSGTITCHEDGRHFRPCHHANVSSRIFETLKELENSDNSLIVRKMYPWLPAFKAAFKAAEPLTRIRAIAHRNDIPRDLKLELKHRLQNKLHRCAGPEDLKTAAELYERINTPGAGCSEAFVAEYNIFFEELQEFFSARSLDDELAAVCEAAMPGVSSRKKKETAKLITAFLTAKQKPDSVDNLTRLLHCLSAVRQNLALLAPDHSDARRQLLLADCRLEDFCFVVLSGLHNHIARLPERACWSPALDAIAAALHNLSLSGYARAEADAVRSELTAWRNRLVPRNRLHLLRLKASLERCLRLARRYCEDTLHLFYDRAAHIGRALRLPAAAVGSYCEDEIRRHFIFQLAKLTERTLRTLRSAAGLAPWDTIVAGTASGQLAALESLADAPAQPNALIVLIATLQGDETLPANVRAIITGSPENHLSHLAIRARQANIVFAACECPETFQKLRARSGSAVCCTALPDRVLIEPSSAGAPSQAAPRQTHGSPIAAACPEASEQPLLPLGCVTAATCGPKAESLRRLQALSKACGCFSVPDACVIPFSELDRALAADNGTAEAYQALLDCTGTTAGCAAACAVLRQLIRELHIPDRLSTALRQRAGTNRLAVRSSASCEDLAGFSAAGLYETVLNINAEEPAEAIRSVWASLWREGAAEARAAAGARPEQAKMAVILQPMLAPDYAFVLHTADPLTGDRNQALAELVVGQGQTLAGSPEQGSPYRLRIDRTAGRAEVLAFASYSSALRPFATGGLEQEIIDYSTIRFSAHFEYAEELARRLATLADAIETFFQGPQDVEGAIVGDELYVVQSRPQGVV